jgi:23S rRNA (cytidine1920-2'-O)/16S rRNA (cytidine1409-2'-O)-methyltransferase
VPRHPRLDHALVDQGLADTRSRAKALILAGDVLVNGQRETRSGHPISATDAIALRQKPRFASRGGEKLDHALIAFEIDVSARVAADFGAIDVGYGQLDERLRIDDRVTVMERTNARYLESLPEPVDVVVIDVSFISLALMFPVVATVLAGEGVCVPLIKPQFEAGRDEVGKGGVVRDPKIHRKVLGEVARSAEAHGLSVAGLIASPLRGPAGNVEFLAHLSQQPRTLEIETMIDHAMAEATMMVAAP